MMLIHSVICTNVQHSVKIWLVFNTQSVSYCRENLTHTDFSALEWLKLKISWLCQFWLMLFQFSLRKQKYNLVWKRDFLWFLGQEWRYGTISKLTSPDISLACTKTYHICAIVGPWHSKMIDLVSAKVSILIYNLNTHLYHWNGDPTTNTWLKTIITV